MESGEVGVGAPTVGAEIEAAFAQPINNIPDRVSTPHIRCLFLLIFLSSPKIYYHRCGEKATGTKKEPPTQLVAPF